MKQQTAMHAEAADGRPTGLGCIRTFWPLCLGYGLYLAYYPIGPMGTAMFTQLGATWQTILLSRALFLAATVAVIVWWRATDADDVLHGKVLAGWVCLACATVVALGFALVPVGNPDWILPVLETVFGMALATPLLGFYEALATVYRSEGRRACVVCIAACFFVAVLFQPLTAVMALGSLPAGVTMAALVAASWAFWERCVQLPALRDADALGERRQDYHTSSYTKVVLIGFGLTWAFTFSTAIGVGFGGSIGHAVTWGVMVAGLGVNALIIALFAFVDAVNRARFGLIMRWTVAFVGSAWAIVPLMVDPLPVGTSFLCSTVYVVQNLIIILFICEIAHEHNVTVCAVTMCHLGLFVGAAVVGALIFWALFTFLGTDRAFQTMSAVAVIASLAVIPMLPSRSSKAAVFALDELPEDDRYEDRVRRARETIATRYALSSRETEVLALIVDGHSREEMAQVLTISPWTVKRHVASIYEKTGVHSVRELMMLVSSGA